MGLFKPAWMNKSEDKAVVAVKTLNDQQKLARAAKEAPSCVVRSAAIKKLTDQAVLAEIAESETDYSVRAIAVEKIDDKTVLRHIFETDENEWVRATANEKLTGKCRKHEYVAIEPERITSMSGHTAQKYKCKRCGKIVELTGYRDNW